MNDLAEPPTSRTLHRAAWYAAAILIALIGGGFAPLTAPAQVTVAALGAVVTAWALGARVPGLAPPLRRTAPGHIDGRGAALWAALAVAFTAWELFALFHGPRPAYPTVSYLAGPALRPRLGRAAAYLIWLTSGAWLARR